jgi:hypothetical protein
MLVHGRPFQPSLIFVSEARAYPSVPMLCFSKVTCLTSKYYFKLERLTGANTGSG